MTSITAEHSLQILQARLATRSKTLTAQQQALLTNVDALSRGWWPLIQEATTGAWQRNEELTVDTITAHIAVFACISLIASDCGKIRLRLVEQGDDQIWRETQSNAFSPVLRKPNHYQTRQKFVELWQTSRLTTGNTYVLKRRDDRNVVNGLYILNPTRVRPMVAPDTSVFYELKTDLINGLSEDIVYVPASEIIHDIYLSNYQQHPLVGLGPLYACGLAALQGLKIQNSSTAFFGNGALPSGVLTAAGEIKPEQAERIKAKWDTAFSGENAGKVAVLGYGLKFEPMAMKFTDAQLLEQLKWTAEAVCTAFRVPPHKINVGQMPNYNNIQALDIQYYSQCLQEKLEAMEALLDEGLELPTSPRRLGTEFDVDELWRMDTATLIESEKNAKGIKSPNESRLRLNLPPVEGGDTPYLQQQDYSLAALDRRENQPTPEPVAPQPSPAEPSAEGLPEEAQTRAAVYTRVAQIAMKNLEAAHAG